jgi:N-acetylglucosaminyl-diphospho-decaprenol L-rhamnosyltransferase
VGERVSAVVVNYNAGHHLLDCVRSLEEEGVTEIVVVDNDSSDGSAQALARARPDVALVAAGANLGYGTAANRGAARCGGELILVSNPDVTLEPGALKSLVAALDADDGLGLVGPRIEDPEGSLYPSPRTFPALGDALGHAFLGLAMPGNRFTRRYRMLDWDHTRAGRVDWVSGSCFLARRRAWDALAGFDEAYFMYAEDVDLCWRAQQAGWRVGFEPAARVTHVQGVSTDLAAYRMILAHHRSLLRFSYRSTAGWRRALLPLVAVGLGLRAALACAERTLRQMGAR